MTDATQTSVSSSPSHIIACIAHGLEAVFERCGPYDDQGTLKEAHIACLTEMETFCRGIVEHMQRVRSQLRLRLSLTARINQLPADVLIHVFASMKFDDLVTATHVCHQWRKLGLETPALWADLTLDGPVLADADMLLARSRATPVHLTLSPSSVRAVHEDTSIASLVRCMDRLQGLSIRPTQPMMYNYWAKGKVVVLPLPRVLRLEYLHVDWDVYPRLVHITAPQDAETNRPDFSSLKHVVLQRGIGGADFLRYCMHLRVLSLHIPATLSDIDIMRVVGANPLLQHLVLRVSRTEGRSLGFNPGHGDKLVHANLCSIELAETGFSYTGMEVSDSGVAQEVSDSGIALASFILTRIDCSIIPAVHLDFGLRVFELSLYSSLLCELHDVVILDISVYGHVFAQDSRGFTRCFSLAMNERPRLLEFPALDVQVRALRVNVKDWLALLELPHQTVFPSLEELSICGRVTVEEDALLRPAAVCPRLRVLTLELYRVNQRMNIPHEQLLAVDLAIALRRVCQGAMPRLERLRIAPGTPPYWRSTTWRCAPPLPETIEYFYYDPRAHARSRESPSVLDSGVCMKNHWPLFPSIPGLHRMPGGRSDYSDTYW